MAQAFEFYSALTLLGAVSVHMVWSELRFVRDCGEAAKQAQARRHARLAAEADRVANEQAAAWLRGVSL